MKGIYIVEFDVYPGLYKIGKSKNIEARIKQFQNSTVLLDGVKLIYYKEFENYTKAEKDIHSILKEYRFKNNREFFSGDVTQFIKEIESLNPDNYKQSPDKKQQHIVLSDRSMIYVLQMQVEKLNQRVIELEQNNKSIYKILYNIRDILKNIITTLWKKTKKK